jgi:hypothetical protein
VDNTGFCLLQVTEWICYGLRSEPGSMPAGSRLGRSEIRGTDVSSRVPENARAGGSC